MPEPNPAGPNPAGPNAAQPFPGLLLTGATGFVGRALQQHLLVDRPNPPPIDPQSTEQPSTRVPRVTALVRDTTTARRAELHPSVRQQAMPLTSSAAWSELLQAHPDWPILLLAGSVRGRSYADFEAANVEIVRAATEALGEQSQPPPILLISSLAASQPELSHYAASKFAGEQLLRQTDLPWTILRPTAVYGCGDEELASLFRSVRAGLVPRTGPADQRLSFIHVTDLCRAIEAWLGAPAAVSRQGYSLDDGTPGGYSWTELAAAIAPQGRKLQFGIPRPVLVTLAHLNLALSHLLGYQPMLTPGKTRELCYPRWLCDNAPFTSACGWHPTTKLSQGVADYFS